jgi:putative peptidoglycan lipid II flippase
MVKSFIKKISEHQTEGINVAALIIAVASFLSFGLGLIRDRLLTGYFGAGNELDVYYTAFRIPDFVALVLMMGAISVAIIPIFTENLTESKEKSFAYLANLINVSLVFLTIVCAVLFIFSPALIALIAPGFSVEKQQATVGLTRIMFLSPILLGLSNIISAVLMVFKRFLITSLSPILYNLGSIIGIVFFVPVMGIQGLAWGIVLGAAMHLLIQIPSLLNTGFRFKKVFNFKEKDFIQTIKLTIPRAIGLTASQINLIIVTAIGSTLLVGSVGIFSLANDLSSPIIGLVAIPFATAVFPALSLAITKGDINDFLRKFYSAFRQIIFLIIPASGLCFLLRAHLVRIIFGAGKFDWSATKLTAACFGIFMITLFAQGLVFLVSKAFYAIKNTTIPTAVSIISIAILPPLAYFFVNLLSYQNAFSNSLSSILKVEGMRNLAVMGLPLAISIDALIQIILLLCLLKLKIKELEFKHLFIFSLKVLLATVVTVIFTYALRQTFGGFLGSDTFMVMFIQTGIVGLLGFAFYFLVAYAMKLPETSSLKYLFNRISGTKK